MTCDRHQINTFIELMEDPCATYGDIQDYMAFATFTQFTLLLLQMTFDSHQRTIDLLNTIWWYPHAHYETHQGIHVQSMRYLNVTAVEMSLVYKAVYTGL